MVLSILLQEVMLTLVKYLLGHLLISFHVSQFHKFQQCRTVSYRLLPVLQQGELYVSEGRN